MEQPLKTERNKQSQPKGEIVQAKTWKAMGWGCTNVLEFTSYFLYLPDNLDAR